MIKNIRFILMLAAIGTVLFGGLAASDDSSLEQVVFYVQ